MSDRAIIELPHQYVAQVRYRRRPERPWGILTANALVAIPLLASKDAPDAGSVRDERFRIVGGRLFRRVGFPADRLQGRPATVADVAPGAKSSGLRDLIELPELGRLPWKREEWPRPGGSINAANVAEIIVDTSPEYAARLQRKAVDHLVAVDGVLHVAAHPPVVSVHTHQCAPRVLSSLELAKADPVISNYACHYESLFSAERRDDAAQFALRLRAAAPQETAARFPGLEEIPDLMAHVAPEYAAHFRCDDLISSARWNLPFSAWFPEEQTAIFGGMGLAALGELRDVCSAMESVEGQTRANARRGYAAVSTMLQAPDGGYWGPGRCEEERVAIRRVSAHLHERAQFDRTFSVEYDAGLSGAEDDALEGFKPRP